MLKIAKTKLPFLAVILVLGLNTTRLQARTIAKSDISQATVNTVSEASASNSCGCNKKTKTTRKSSSYTQAFMDYQGPADVDITEACLDFIHCSGGYDCLFKSLRCAGSDMPFFMDLVMY